MAARAEAEKTVRQPSLTRINTRERIAKQKAARKSNGVWATSDRFPNQRINLPGPAAYRVPNRINGRAAGGHHPGYSFRARTTGGVGTGFMRQKKVSHESPTPGPGKYEASGPNLKGKTFSPLLKNKYKNSPGPADYVSSANTLGKTGEKYTLRARTKSAWSADMGSDWRSKTLHKSKSAPAFYKGLIADSSTPGPGKYEPYKPIGAAANKKTISLHHETPQVNYPGPAAYTPKDRLIGKDEAHTYSLHMRTKNKLGGSFMQGDTDGKFVPYEYNPGPGKYNHTSSMHVQSFNKFTAAGTNSSVQYCKAPVAEFESNKTIRKAKVY